MRQNRPIRVIKHAGTEGHGGQQAVGVRERNAAPAAREVRTVVTGWVRERQQHSEEFRRNYSALLKEHGFNFAGVSSRG